MADALLISIVRRPGEVVALISERDAKAEEPQPFAIRSVPLDRVSRSLYARKEKLQESWRYLAKVAAADEDALYHVMVVAIESVPDVSIVETPAPLPIEWDASDVRPKATSTHPRAFKGTKYRPPKVARLAPLDIRPYLCDIGSIRDLLAPLQKFQPKVRARLQRTGYSLDILDAIERELSIAAPTRGGTGRKCWTMPASFVQYIWPLVRWRTPRDVSAHLSLYVVLDLEKDESLLCKVSQFIAASEGGHACAWCHLAIDLPPHRRLPFIDALLDVSPAANAPKSSVRAQLEQVWALASDEQFSNWVAAFLETVRDSGTIDYLLAGFRLAVQFHPRHPSYPFGVVGKCDDFPEQIVEEIGVSLAEVEGGAWLPLTLWERCGRLPGLGAIIRKSAWRRFTPDAAYRYFRFFIDIAYSSIPEASLWGALQKQVPHIETLLQSTAAIYQNKRFSICPTGYCGHAMNPSASAC